MSEHRTVRADTPLQHHRSETFTSWPHLCASAAVLAMVSAGVDAHHSFAMFDNTKEVTIEGTVKEFQWTNPHTWIQLVVRDPSTGDAVEWGIEGSPTTSLKRRGWSKDSIKSGDHAVVIVYPLRSGAPGGGLVKVTVNGKVVGGTPSS